MAEESKKKLLGAVVIRGRDVLLLRQEHGLHHLPLVEEDSKRDNKETLQEAVLRQTGHRGEVLSHLYDSEPGPGESNITSFYLIKWTDEESEGEGLLRVWLPPEEARKVVHWNDSLAIQHASPGGPQQSRS